MFAENRPEGNDLTPTKPDFGATLPPVDPRRLTPPLPPLPAAEASANDLAAIASASAGENPIAFAAAAAAAAAAVAAAVGGEAAPSWIPLVAPAGERSLRAPSNPKAAAPSPSRSRSPSPAAAAPDSLFRAASNLASFLRFGLTPGKRKRVSPFHPSNSALSRSGTLLWLKRQGVAATFAAFALYLSDSAFAAAMPLLHPNETSLASDASPEL